MHRIPNRRIEMKPPISIAPRVLSNANGACDMGSLMRISQNYCQWCNLYSKVDSTTFP